MQREDYLSIIIIIAGLLAATLTGFLREATLANQLGTGRAADIYLIAYSVPEFVIIAIMIIIPPALIPLFTELKRRYSESEAWHFEIQVLGAVSGFLLLICLLAVVTAPLYLNWLAPGFNESEYNQAVLAARYMMPAIVMMGCAVVISAALQVYRRFTSTAITTATYNLIFVVVLFLAPIAWSVGNTALGVVLGAAAALMIQVPFLWRYRAIFIQHNYLRKGSNGFRNGLGSIHKFSRLVGPLAVGYTIHHVIWFIDRAMATTLGVGSVATLNYAYRLALVVGQFSGLAVSTAIFPRFSQQVADNDDAGLISSLTGSLGLVWIVGLPATCFIILLREPLIQVLYEHGAFRQASTYAVSQVIVWYSLAVLADAMCQPLWRIIYAWRKVWTVSAVNGFQTVVRLVCNIVLIRYFDYRGIAISAMVGLTLQVLLLGWLIQRRLGYAFLNKWWQNAWLVIVASFFASLGIIVISRQFLSAPALITLTISGLAGGFIYLLIIGPSNWRKISSGIISYRSPNKE